MNAFALTEPGWPLAIMHDGSDDAAIMRSAIPSCVLVATLLWTASCTRKPEPDADPGPRQQTHSVTGVVISLKPLEKQAVIRHEEIPGYMMAMTMPFFVQETNELVGLIPGEEITFTMIVTEDDAWIEGVEKTGNAENILPPGAGIRIARDVEPLQIGDTLPEYHFINEQGRDVHLAGDRGEALVLSFIFTRCPVPNFCPLTARKLAETQTRLLANSGGATNWHIFAITMDPDFDTPERLKHFGEAYGYKPEHWSFLTGELIDITALAEQFGLIFWTEDGTVNHNLRTVVVGADGTIRTNIIGNEWKVETLVGEVVKAAKPVP